ncbi:hypothetical protein ScPMuIL_010795 [Solemya velum]
MVNSLRRLSENPNAVLQQLLTDFNVTDACKDDNSLMWNGIYKLWSDSDYGQMWAMQMLDASGKIPSGLLQGNINWLGSYDECTNITVTLTEEQIANRTLAEPYGVQYCRVSISLLPLYSLGKDEDAIPMAARAMANGMIGVCIPRSCTKGDAAGLVAAAISLIPSVGTSMASQVMSTRSRMRTVCQEDPPKMDTKAKAAIAVCVIFVILYIAGTTYDVMLLFRDEKLTEKPSSDNHSSVQTTKRGTMEQAILSFSLYTNVSKLLNTKQGSGTLTAVNGIRFVSMSWVLIGHSYPTFLLASANPAEIQPLLKRFTFQTIANATVSTDSFFVLSGLLVGYLSFKEMKKLSDIKSWCQYYAYYYFHRYWRLTPVYMLLILIYVSLWPYVGDGPMWSRLSPEPDQCRNSWWKGMLYINNFFPKEQCIGWVWYLANDMQMYWVSPLIITPLFFSWIAGGVVVVLSLIGTFVAAGVISYHYNLTAQPVSGGGEDGVWSSEYYIMPYCRIGPYIIGIITGYILYRTKCQYKMKVYWNLLGWGAATILCTAVLYGTNDYFQGHPFSREVAALYNALHRPINTFLSWSAWVPLSRLTYCTYMVHLIVLNYNKFTARSVPYFNDIDAVYHFLGTLVISLMCAFVLSIAFEAPMLGLEKAFIVPHLKHKKRK